MLDHGVYSRGWSWSNEKVVFHLVIFPHFIGPKISQKVDLPSRKLDYLSGIRTSLELQGGKNRLLKPILIHGNPNPIQNKKKTNEKISFLK